MSETKNLKLFKHEEPLETNNNKFDIDKALNQNWDKVDEYVEKVNTEITNLQNNKVDKEEGKGLSTNDFTNEEKEKLAGLNNYDDTEIIDLLPKVSNKGESIALENTARAKFTKFRIGGNSSQETREGYNLCNVTDQTKYGVTFKKMKNGILLNGKSTETFDVTVCEKTVAGGNYCIKGLGSTASNSTFQEIIYKNDTIDCYVATTSKIRAFADNDVLKSRLYIYKDTTFNNLLVPVQITKSDDKDYEPYGTMPSEEFPSEIKNVKENVRINIRNKNFCDLDILEKLKEKAITINSSNSFTINLENGRMGITSRINIMLPDGIDKSKKYRIKYHRKMNNTSFLPRLSALYADGSNDGVEDRILEADYEYVTSGKELSGITLAWNTQNQGGIVTFSDISITEINENSDFEESKKQTIIFPFKQGQKLMQGDYLADDGIHHTKTQIQLDGVTAGLKVTNVTKNSNDIYYCVIKIIKQGINGINNMYCSHFTPYFKVKPGSCYITGSGGTIVLASTDQTITTVDAANTWLATQKEKGTPVVIEYELAEEEIETYTEVQKEAYEQIKNAISYKGQTNIFSTNEIKPIFEVEALADIGLLLNNMQAQILAGGE